MQSSAQPIPAPGQAFGSPRRAGGYSTVVSTGPPGKAQTLIRASKTDAYPALLPLEETQLSYIHSRHVLSVCRQFWRDPGLWTEAVVLGTFYVLPGSVRS